MTTEHKIMAKMTIFKYIIIRLIIFLTLKTGTGKEIQKTKQKTSQKRSLCSFSEIFLVISPPKKGFHFNDS